jgi:hypothetical protein
MTDAHKVPPDVTDSPERIKERPYESDFARLPASETHPRTVPGAGPQGPVAAGPINMPLVVMSIGALVAFSVFFINTWLLLVLGLLIIAVGAGMSIVIHHRPGRRSGLGRSDVADT